MSKMIDLRSDTVTRPCEAMRAAMAAAEVGDEVFDDDPTIDALEARAAQLLGTESALFVCSGTMSNLLALMSHCARGEEYIVGQEAHTYKYEGGGAAVLGSIQPQPLDFASDGTLPLAAVEGAIKPDDSHFARTRLICLENTQAGKVLPLEYLARASALARARGLNIHLDGARVFNAAVASGVDVAEIAQHFDSISVCLSKGLGAPVGSLLCGSTTLIADARRWRKMLGGTWRQGGILAAAGLYALECNVERLAEDHRNAEWLAVALGEIAGLEVTSTATNMVFASVSGERWRGLAAGMKTRGVLIYSRSPQLRLVTHRDITRRDLEAAVEALKAELA